jgi:hypothetical protein
MQLALPESDSGISILKISGKKKSNFQNEHKTITVCQLKACSFMVQQ